MSFSIGIQSILMLMIVTAIIHLTVTAEHGSSINQSYALPGVYIVEFSTRLSSIRTKNHHELFYNELFFHKEVLKNTKITPRLNISSSVFIGASFHLSNSEELSSISVHPAVSNIWPVSVYPRPSPRIDSVINVSNSRINAERFTSRDTYTPHTMTGVNKLHNQGFNGKGVIIAIIDTGIDYRHPDLGGGFGPGYKVQFGYDFVGDDYNGTNTPIQDPDPMDCDGHGTHVAGIIGANNAICPGVAPKATLAAYRVFGCTGVVSDDVLIAAFTRAHDSGVHMISASIGSASGWTESPWTVVVSRIVAAGTPCMQSAGNSGDQGLFLTGGAADGIDVTAVGSVDNLLTPQILIIGKFFLNGLNPTIFEYLSSDKFPDEASMLPLYALSLNTSNPADACTKLPSTTPSLADKIVLIRRGTCLFVTKIANVQKYRAKYILFYTDERPIVAPVTVNGIYDGMVSAEQGAQWINNLINGINITLKFFNPLQTTFKSTVNNITGGTMSTFSSWSPTYELYIKPEISAPGGNILSTYPLDLGGYAVLSGTSMATPFITGVVALYKQAKGINIRINPLKIRNILATTATPLFFNDKIQTYPFLAPVVQQGAGLVNAFLAVTTTTLISPTNIALNDTTHFRKKVKITIFNTSPRSLRYSLSHKKARTAYALAVNSSSPQLFPPDFSNQSAKVIFHPRVLTIRKNSRAVVRMEFTSPADLDMERIPVYSGYIHITSSKGESFHVPYAGVGTSMKDVAVTDFKSGFPYISKGETTNKIDPAMNTTVKFKFPADPVYINWRLAMGSSLVRIDVLGRGRKTTIAGIKILGSIAEFPEHYQPRNAVSGSANSMPFNENSWNGTLSDNKTVPAGYYRLLYRALKIFGNRENKGDYESWISPRFRVTY